MRDRPAVLVALVLIAGGLIAYALLRASDDSESEPPPATTTRITTPPPTQTQTAAHTLTVAETPTVTEAETEPQTQTETRTQAQPATTQQQGGFEAVIGTDYRVAVGRLLADGLLPDTYPAASIHPRGVVIAQSPAVGANVEPGAAVRLTVSQGRGARPVRTVPYLTGMQLPKAIRACAAAGFTCTIDGERGRRRIVSTQRPNTGRTLPALTPIVLITR